MRDILVTLIVVGLLPMILKTPRLGAYAWAWLAMMVPHRLGFGFARDLPFSQMVGLATLVGFLATKEKYPIPRSSILVPYGLFLFWMTITSLFALDSGAAIFARWVEIFKIHFFIFVMMMLIRGQKQIEQLIWVITLSLGFYGFKGGLFTIETGGGGRVWGPPGGVIAGNNALGVALVMLVPLMYFLFLRSIRRWVRWGIALMIALTFLAILGTQSRGALLSLLTMAFFLALRGKRPVLTSITVGVLLVLAIAFMPDSWTRRMDTIETYNTDGSAMSRIYTWQTLWNLALDRPLVGAGFNAAIPMVFLKYAPRMVGDFDFSGVVLVAHSIYFQALGEHGFPGLIFYLSIGLTTVFRAGRLAKLARDDDAFKGWVPLLMRMIQASFAGFAVGGAFLSMVHFDFPYYLIAIVALTDATMAQARRN